MTSYTTPLVVDLIDGRRWKLAFAFTFHVGSKYAEDYIPVPAGFDHDFASIPRFLFVILPWWAKFNKASVLHDYLYRDGGIRYHPQNDHDAAVNLCRFVKYMTRKEADDIFYEAMLVSFRDHRFGRLVALLEYKGVRLFSWLAWRKR